MIITNESNPIKFDTINIIFNGLESIQEVYDYICSEIDRDYIPLDQYFVKFIVYERHLEEFNSIATYYVDIDHIPELPGRYIFWDSMFSFAESYKEYYPDQAEKIMNYFKQEIYN